jgi:hypothetical protein
MSDLINVAVLVVLSLFNFVNSQIPTTPGPSGCPGGGIAYQDIAILYDLTFFPDNSSITFSQQIANAIGTTLFSGPAYQYYQQDGITRATQITPLPFPETSEYNILAEDYSYGGLRSDHLFKTLLQDQVRHSTINMFHHPIESKISDALSYLMSYTQNQRRPAPVKNTIVIISKRDTDVSNSLSAITALKTNGSKIMTIGVGNGSLSSLSSLSSGTGYNFMIPDITDANAVNNVAQQIASQLITDCGITWTPLPSTTPLPTTPYTGSSTTTTTPPTTITTTTTPPSTVSVSVSSMPVSSTTTVTVGTPSTSIQTPATGNDTTTTTTTTIPSNSTISTSSPITNTATTPTPTTPTTTPKNEDKDGSASFHSFSYFFLFLSFLYTFVNHF